MTIPTPDSEVDRDAANLETINRLYTNTMLGTERWTKDPAAMQDFLKVVSNLVADNIELKRKIQLLERRLNMMSIS